VCEPVTVGAIVGATLLESYSKYQEGQTTKAALEAQARQQEQQAGDARQRGAIEAGMVAMQTSQTAEEQKLAFATVGGVDPTTGTAMDTQRYTRAVGTLKSLDIENDAIRQAWGYEASAKMSRYKGKLSEDAGTFGATSSLIGGGAKAAMTGNRLATTR